MIPPPKTDTVSQFFQQQKVSLEREGKRKHMHASLAQRHLYDLFFTRTSWLYYVIYNSYLHKYHSFKSYITSYSSDQFLWNYLLMVFNYNNHLNTNLGIKIEFGASLVCVQYEYVTSQSKSWYLRVIVNTQVSYHLFMWKRSKKHNFHSWHV